jgi:DNA helicase II / ATP-dependent DNA helicase PcrA
MRFLADLHVHSRFSRATAHDLDLPHLFASARRKGVGVIGTGDFTHPLWMAEIRDQLEPAEPGLFRLRPDLEATALRGVPAACAGPVRFALSAEISTIYKRDGRTRKVHHLILVPGLQEAERVTRALARIGNLASDGRPILGLDSRDLLEIVLQAGPSCHLVPAHIWTPWFSALGSMSGFDSIAACYADLADHVFAVETGLSSDPPMNWRVSSLDRYRLVSNSDAHSPEKVGREATAFDCPVDYFALIRALQTGEGYIGTVEFFPEEGKYHLDGHRACDVRLEPDQTNACGGACPVCGKPVTVGVMHRVNDLGDRSDPVPPATAGVVRSLVPLREVVAEIEGTGPDSKAVDRVVDGLCTRIGPEMAVLADVPLEDLRRAWSELGAEAIARLRRGEVTREAA